MLPTLLLFLLLAAIIILILRAAYIFSRIDKAFERFKFPGLPIFRHLFLVNNPEKLLTNCLEIQNRYGKSLKIDLIGKFGGILTSDLTFIEYLLGTTNLLNKSLVYKFMENWLGTGLITCTREKWKKTRKALTPAFHFQILDQYVETFEPAGQTLLKKLKGRIGKDPFDIYQYIVLCTLDIICEAAMGVKVHAQSKETSDYVKAVHEISRITADRGYSLWKIPGFLYVFSSDYWREKICLKTLHNYTDLVIETRRDELLKNNGQQDPKKRMAFLDLILKSTIDGRPLTNQEIREEVNTFLFAGHDTTASAISFALFCLSKEQDVQQKVVNELDEVFGDDKTRGGTIKELNKLKYMEMVIKETLRLYPPVPIYLRGADYDVSYYDGTIPKLTQIGIFCYGVHHSPENYENPHIFDPERFTPENSVGRNPFSFIPFSAGARNCIGQKFAMYELKSTLSLILRNYVILAAPEYELKLIPLPVLKATNGIYIKLEERN